MPNRGAPLRVLIVEDEALLAMQVECLLLEAGHEPVGHALDTAEALTLARALKPDLALVDVHLRDGLTGVELMRTLTGEHGVAGVFVTANLGLIPADFAGALAAVSKPFSETAFQQALRYIARRLRGAIPERVPPPSLALSPRLRPGDDQGAGRV